MERVKRICGNVYIQVFFIVCALAWTLGLRTSNVFALVVAIPIFWFLKRKMPEQNRLEKRIAGILAVLFSVLWVAGNYNGYGNEGVILIAQYAISVIGLSLLLNKVLCEIFHWMITMELSCETECRLKPFQVWIGVFVICLVCWLPYFLAYYPGVVTDDAEWQLAQAIGITEYSNHQPWLHTLLHKFFYNIGYSIFQDQNAGVATCVLMQMCTMAGTFGYVICQFYKEKMNRWFLLGCLIYFAIIPFNALYAVTLWKDVLIGAIVVLFSFSVWKMTLVGRKTGVGNYVLFFLTGFLLCVFRSNGFYAYLLCIPFFLIFLKGKRKMVLPICVLTVVLTLIYKGPVLSHYGVIEPDTIESLSIPAQHIARVIADGGELSEEQRALLEKAVDVDMIASAYDPALSDPIKTLVRQHGDQQYIAEHKGEFLLLWLELGLEHPSTYLKAQIDQTKGYWYPDVQYWVTTTMMKDNDWGMHRDQKLPDLIVQIMKLGETAYMKIPFLGLLWSIGFFTWAMLVMAGAAIFRKHSVLPFLPVLAILVSLFIATPVQAEFRYSYSMMTTMPLFIMIACSGLKMGGKTDEKNSSTDTVLQ